MKKTMGIALMAVALLVSGLAFAEGKGEHKGFCKADQEKFCKDVEVGKGGVHKCLKGHKAELSPDCAATFKK